MTPHLIIRHSLDFNGFELTPMNWDGEQWCAPLPRHGAPAGLILIEGTVNVPAARVRRHAPDGTPPIFTWAGGR